MRLHRVEIDRFRGIRQLAWDVEGRFVCLIGPNDSTKTTILDAIELALSPRWNTTFDDSDFYGACTDEDLVVRVTVGSLPDELASDAKFGLEVRGWSPSGELHDEPEADDDVVLTVELRVDSSLEPRWAVVNERNPEGKQISARDREKLGSARLGDFLDRHFSWGRGSALARLTGEVDSLSAILANAARAARTALAQVAPDDLPKLHQAAADATRVGSEVGVAPTSEYRPHLDVQAATVRVGGLSLHDGEIPVRRAGLGTRRLLAVAMQRDVAKTGGLTLIDEVEHGLEPHRVRHLLRVLRTGDGNGTVVGQVLMTTHAPVVLGELTADELRVVRCRDGVTEVRCVPAELQPILRKASEAFLARKVIVCEGKTEIGLCRRLDESWGAEGSSFALSGIALADGGGHEAPTVAQALAELGYDVVLVGDSDRALEPEPAVLEAAGVKVLLWADDVAIEERIALDLPWHGVAAVVDFAMSLWGDDPVRDAVAARASLSRDALNGAPDTWCDAVPDEVQLRRAIGLAAKKHKVTNNRSGWFKRVDLADDLAQIVIEYLHDVADSDLARKVATLRAWAHGDR